MTYSESHVVEALLAFVVRFHKICSVREEVVQHWQDFYRPISEKAEVRNLQKA
jgi:hypothetical protein